MRPTPIWRRYLRFLGSDPAADVEDELGFHLAMRVDDLVRQGLPEEEARRRAAREFGDVWAIRRELNEIGRGRLRRERRGGWWDSLGQDVRAALAGFRRTPGYTAVAVLTLALGIGGATALFSVVAGVLLRPLPYPEPERLVQVWQLGERGLPTNFSEPNFRDVRERARGFSSLAAFQQGEASISAGGDVSRRGVARVSGEFLAAVGAPPVVGRAFTDEEVASGAAVALVSEEYWRAALRADPDLGEEPIRVGDRLHAVVGVLPAGRTFPRRTDVWVPREVQGRTYRTGHNWQVVGRLAPGVGLEAAGAELSAIATELKREWGDDTAMTDAMVVPLREQMVGWARPALLVLLAGSGFLLLVACANLVSLQLARASARGREIAVRQALGAGRGRLARQFLVEALLLCLAGGAAGVALAAAGVELLLALEPGVLPRVEEVRVDGVVLAFALAVSAGVATVLGIVTALRATDTGLRGALAASARTLAGGMRTQRARDALTALQVALAAVLLVGAGLLGRSFLRLLDVDPGFRTSGALVLDVVLPEPRDEAAVQRLARVQEAMLAGLGALPGVEAAGVTDARPLSGRGSNGGFLVLTHPDEVETLDDFARLSKDPSRTGFAHYRVASGGYFRAMGIPLLRGRLFDERDTPDAPHVAVISQSLAERRWPGEDPIGKVVQFGNMDRDVRAFTVVGVVGDVRHQALDAPPGPVFYGNALQRHLMLGGPLSVVLAGTGAPARTIPAARRMMASIAPELPVAYGPIEAWFAEATAVRRFSLLLLGAFALAALALTVTGIFGVISHLVAQRRRDFGIRLALGATEGRVVRQVLARGLLLTAVGLAFGAAGAAAGARVLRSQLFEVGAVDPLTFVAVALLLACAALLASYVPARAAARLEPDRVLRTD